MGTDLSDPGRPQLPAQAAPPRCAVVADGIHTITADTWALPVLTGDDTTGVLLGPGSREVGEHLGLDLVSLVEASGATGAVGEAITIPVVSDDVRRVLAVGVGSGTSEDLRRAGAALGRAVAGEDRVATSIAALADDVALEGFVAGMTLASYQLHWRDRASDRLPVARVDLCGRQEQAIDAALARATAIAEAAWLSRHLATVPANLKSPQWLAQQAVEVAGTTGLTCQVWDEVQLAADGFGGIVAVGAGSASPPRLVRLDYTPAGMRRRKRASMPLIALVGKGITFDTGGLSIKPPDNMLRMKRDMTGAAVVLGVMSCLSAVGCPVRVVGLLALAENAISGTAMRPGDVITHYDGQTTEITNTDAEGRLVLADGIAYAVKHLEPDAIVDVATLTGAMKVALGLQTAGFMSDNDELASAFTEAAARAGEPLWRMPLVDSYRHHLRSSIADADHCAESGPGAIMAALFLHRFTGGVPWLHLDIAPVADTLKERHEYTTGPSGFGTRTLVNWLGAADPLASVAKP